MAKAPTGPFARKTMANQRHTRSSLFKLGKIAAASNADKTFKTALPKRSKPKTRLL